MTAQRSEVRYSAFDIPIGRAVVVCNGTGLTGLSLFPGREESRGHLDTLEKRSLRDDDDPRLTRARLQIGEYFDGGRFAFELDLDPQGTPFQRQVWDALLGIPFGETVTYGEIATRLGQPASVRAVGAANGRNPIAIVIPCHRVIGSGGRLTGYAAGLAIKRALLQHEGAIAPTLPL